TRATAGPTITVSRRAQGPRGRQGSRSPNTTQALTAGNPRHREPAHRWTGTGRSPRSLDRYVPGSNLSPVYCPSHTGVQPTTDVPAHYIFLAISSQAGLPPCHIPAVVSNRSGQHCGDDARPWLQGESQWSDPAVASARTHVRPHEPC